MQRRGGGGIGPGKVSTGTGEGLRRHAGGTRGCAAGARIGAGCWTRKGTHSGERIIGKEGSMKLSQRRGWSLEVGDGGGRRTSKKPMDEDEKDSAGGPAKFSVTGPHIEHLPPLRRIPPISEKPDLLDLHLILD